MTEINIKYGACLPNECSANDVLTLITDGL